MSDSAVAEVWVADEDENEAVLHSASGYLVETKESSTAFRAASLCLRRVADAGCMMAAACMLCASKGRVQGAR
jgi:hypothetical protein